MEQDELRAKIEAKVEDGVLTPEQAEAEAKRRGLEPLNPQPDPAEFMDDPFWNFPQAIGWIAWRTPETVREHADRHRENYREWLPTAEGFVLRKIRPKRSTYSFLQNVCLQDGKPPVVAVAEGHRQLWQALQAGKLETTAIDLKTDKRRQIDHLEFQDLELSEDHEYGVGTFDTLRCYRRHRHVYRDPLVKSSDVREIWPASTNSISSASAAAVRSASAKSACQLWLEEEMRKSPHKRPKRRNDFKAAALKRFTDLSGRAFDRAWATAIAATGATAWTWPDRPKKSPQ